LKAVLGDEQWNRLKDAAEQEKVPLDCSRARLVSYIRRLENVVLGEDDPPTAEEIREGAEADEADRDADERGERTRTRAQEAQEFYGPVELAARLLNLPYEPIELVPHERDPEPGTRAAEEDDAGHLRGVDDEVTKEMVLQVDNLYFSFTFPLR
jgi:hypothetical protein